MSVSVWVCQWVCQCVCQCVHTHGMHDFIMDGLKKASLIRWHLSKVLKEERGQALWIVAGRGFQDKRKDPNENCALHSLGTTKKPTCWEGSEWREQGSRAGNTVGMDYEGHWGHYKMLALTVREMGIIGRFRSEVRCELIFLFNWSLCSFSEE